jgi:hypothetical protein
LRVLLLRISAWEHKVPYRILQNLLHREVGGFGTWDLRRTNWKDQETYSEETEENTLKRRIPLDQEV